MLGKTEFGFTTRNKYIFFIIATLLCAGNTEIYGSEKKQKTAAIATSKAILRESPNFLSRPTVVVSYGTIVDILEKKGDWIKIRLAQNTGWLPSSALQGSRIILKEVGKGEKTKSSIYDKEITTAGKGFSPEYEAMIKSENPKLNYLEVDKLEKRELAETQLFEFAKAAGVKSIYEK